MLLTLLGLALAAVIIFCITLAMVKDHIRDNIRNDTKLAAVIKQRTANGKYKVRSGVFNRSGEVTAAKEWEANEIDSELERNFGNSNEIVLETAS